MKNPKLIYLNPLQANEVKTCKYYFSSFDNFSI